MKKKYIMVFISLFSFLIGLFFLWTSLLWKLFKNNIAGSYPYAETWTFKVKESKLIKIIDEIRKENPELKPPNVSYSTSGRNGYWYDFVFYYGNTNQDVQTWVQADTDSAYTTFAFVAIVPHIDTLTSITNTKLNRREINSDFGYWENKKEIQKFENTIVKLIEEKIGRIK